MPDDAKKNNTVEVRNLDFEKDNMSTYEDMKGTVYVKNWYTREIEWIEDFKYFIDRWLKIQGGKMRNKQKMNVFKDKKSEKNEIPEEIKEYLTFGHTIFSINVKKLITNTRLYIVSCAPYHDDIDTLENWKELKYIGARSSNEALNKLMEIWHLVKNGGDLDDQLKLPFNDLIFTKLLKNVFQKDSNINFLFSIPLINYNPHIFTSKPTHRSATILKQIIEIKMSHSHSHTLSSLAKMKDYDRIMTSMNFSWRVIL